MNIKFNALASAAYNFYGVLFREGRTDDKYKNLDNQRQKELAEAIKTGSIPSSYDNDLKLAINCVRKMYNLDSPVSKPSTKVGL